MGFNFLLVVGVGVATLATVFSFLVAVEKLSRWLYRLREGDEHTGVETLTVVTVRQTSLDEATIPRPWVHPKAQMLSPTDVLRMRSRLDLGPHLTFSEYPGQEIRAENGYFAGEGQLWRATVTATSRRRTLRKVVLLRQLKATT
ncbi:MAG: hypothetical protein KDD69_04060 [Bdellovibrionales bacterium]|nr:hypothetical protein [Bdellovibrionales bacterium]